MLQDNEGAVNTPLIRENYELSDIGLRNFPPLMGHLMNPCDNRYHSDVDKYLRPQIDWLNSSFQFTTELQLRAAGNAVHSVKPESIVNYFRDCGLIPDPMNGQYEDPSSVMNRLLGEEVNAARFG